MRLRLRGGSDEMEYGTGNASKFCKDIHEIPDDSSSWIRRNKTDVSSYAMDVVRIRFGRHDQLESGRLVGYKPLFVHQVFGYDELIDGYIDPSCNVTYAEDDLRPLISFSSKGKHPDIEKSGLNLTDVVGSIHEHAPADYIAVQEAGKRYPPFKPMGQYLNYYSGYDIGLCEREVTEMNEQRGGSVRFEMYQCHVSSDMSPEIKNFFMRTQSLAIWFIEALSYIELDDPGWSIVLTYEATTLNSKKTANVEEVRYRLVGFATLYRHRLVNTTMEKVKDITPNLEDVVGRNDIFRLNISQFLILPEYQRKGHGAQMMRQIYKIAMKDDKLLDLQVEDPTDGFQEMRMKIELDMLRESKLMDQLRGNSPSWGSLQKKYKFHMVELFDLAQKLGCKVGRRGVKEDSSGMKTVAGVVVNMTYVYERSAIVGFTMSEVDDVLQAILPEDLRQTTGPQDAAEKLLVAIYMAVVADYGQAEGLSDQQVDQLLESVDSGRLKELQSPRDIARLVLPLIGMIKKGLNPKAMTDD
ncbi:hypothetical protein GUITHDRAFT_104111 [Guillardia theta CCMP2712]|uniref:histone acetyltransferase n=1 Tax=Guillardia theta (strain CCMP2712) TaxID=905079 RepID=L1JP04_GUITC|nr:hypothetical protein GUITHDRAFT_104111 [Guillardia theta CCMP2712]EKX50301.1 hypothetical protein GUITHDRAFT_104111 [Guillardia theta CCMP2712]|eukprot:XP_005837281.1 hypothetical protein GUITHDRAFT_104111 [Guillardia theta CCMP2712]